MPSFSEMADVAGVSVDFCPKGKDISLVERFKALFCQQRSCAEIILILRAEFREYEVKNITDATLKTIYYENKEEFDKARDDFATEVAEITQGIMRRSYLTALEAEAAVVDSLSDRLKEAAKEIKTISPTNSPKEYLQSLQVIQQTQNFLGKVAATDTARAMIAHREKLKIEQELSPEKADIRNAIGKTNFIK